MRVGAEWGDGTTGRTTGPTWSKSHGFDEFPHMQCLEWGCDVATVCVGGTDIVPPNVILLARPRAS